MVWLKVIGVARTTGMSVVVTRRSAQVGPGVAEQVLILVVPKVGLAVMEIVLLLMATLAISGLEIE